MAQTPLHNDDVEVHLPCIDGMLAGTLALMTGFAEHTAQASQAGECAGSNARCRSLLAKKIVSNLFYLSRHPQMLQPMALVLGNLQTHWDRLSAVATQAWEVESQGAAPSLAQHPETHLPTPTPASASSQALWLPQHANVQ